MADCASSAPAPQHQLTYTVTNERGWNDPPTSVFSPSGNSTRKRIDPRKARVHHNINAGYYNQPVVNNAAFQSSAMSGNQNNLQNMSLAPGQSPLHHANSNPDLSNMTNNSNTPTPPMIQHATSVPNKLCNTGQNGTNQHHYANGIITPPNSKCNTPPFFTQPNGTHTPPASIPMRKFSAPSSPGGIQGIFQSYATPTMLQTSHLNKSFETARTMVPSKNIHPSTTIPSTTNNILLPSQHTHSRVLSPVPPYTQSFSPVPSYTQSFSPVPMGPPQMSSLPPMTVNDVLNQNSAFSRSNSTPGMLARISPTNVFVAPPPKDGFYTVKRNSPNTASPLSSGKNSPVPNDRIENDSELLCETVTRLNECKTKCSCHLTNKVSDDISKRITVFQNSWTSGKLSTPVKFKMVELSQALQKGEFTQADSIHRSLITGFSSEVMSWMVGIKKLISSYQRAIEENNKYQ